MTSTTPDEIRADIEATRAQLGHDLDELSDRISPHKVAGRTAAGVKDKVAGAGSALKPKLDEATVRARGTAGHAATAAQQTAHRQLDAHPQVADVLHRTTATAGSAMTVGREKAAQTAAAGRAKAGPLITAGRDRARENPRAAGSAAGGAAALGVVAALIARRRRRRRAGGV
ncbi:DUF3618 domain-containing protein [Parafrankia discariae]|uniref:DUF3618 domain-containing protein n=1 Tax=Parafrankia discariae TaxID=365528 RepID=UPI0004784A82|nr:DUF3618 domain-containing protein [Parafrankia discariae]